MQVYVITYCRHPAQLYGSTLTLETIRVGFPTADITVVDNGSTGSARDVHKALAEKVGASWEVAADPPGACHGILIDVLLTSTPGPVVILDVDLIFWERVEHWQFPPSTLAAGRLIPTFDDPMGQFITQERPHTSLLWVPDTERLDLAVCDVRAHHLDFRPWRPYTFKDGERWRRFDPGANFHAVFKAQSFAFEERHLQAYDHLFAGSYLYDLAPQRPLEAVQEWQGAHEAVLRGDTASLRGLYKKQQAFFESRRVD